MLDVLVVTWAPGGSLPPLLAAASLLAGRGHRVEVLASAATRGAVELAHDVLDVIEAPRPGLVVADCMLPAAITAGKAAGTPTAALVHMLYGLARRATVTGGPRTWEGCELVLVTAPRWLDVDREYPSHVVHAGPLGVRTEPGEVKRTRVLLSFSTTVMDGQPEAVQRICDGVAGLEVAAILTLGPAVDGAALRVPSEVEVAEWADHDRLLPSCAAAIGHGGLGTTLRALAHGVPLLLLPLGRDQAFNAARVVELGAGLELPADAAPADVGAALRRLLDEPGFAAAARAAATRIAADTPDARAAEALERCGGRHGRRRGLIDSRLDRRARDHEG